jgi:hypothetical protein
MKGFVHVHLHKEARCMLHQDIVKEVRGLSHEKATLH